MTGKYIDFKKIWKLHFGPYAQVHDDRNAPNNLEESTQGEIYLCPTVNLQGTYNFYEKKTTYVRFTEVPITTIVMKKVAVMALAKKHTKGLILRIA